MMRLRQSLALRYAIVMAACFAVLLVVAYHEFVREPRLFQAAKFADQTEYAWFELAEVGVFASLPVIFCLGWWFILRSLRPIDALVADVEKFDAGNLGQRAPRSHNNDEVDRLAAAFNATASRLEQSFQQLQTFTLGVSHELKTPLTIMRAQLEVLLASDNFAPAQSDSLHATLEEIERLARIVDGITLLTKADAGLVKLARGPVALEEIVRECAEDAAMLAQPLQIEAVLERCDSATISGDRHRLRQVLLNLADNATKYNRPGGRVTLSLERTPTEAVIRIANTGPQVPAEILARAFQRFVRGNGGEKNAGVEGSGLGLTICKWIVEAHGGSIALASVPDCTTVVVRLPLAA
jgi:signal transduction histidine kinase